MNSMRLDELLQGIATPDNGGIVVSGLTQDSHAVRAGDVFVALAGAKHHGIEFAPAAIKQGAVAVLADRGPGESKAAALGGIGSVPAPLAAPPESASHAVAPAGPRSPVPGPGSSSDPRSPIPGPVVWLDGLRSLLGEIAARFYTDPSASMTLIGVTGTNGKTSTVQLLAQAFTHLGKRAATIGTLGAGLHGALHEGERTTPDVIRVHGLLAEFRDAGTTHVAMEVSSHALDQQRVDGVHFDVAVFTNLTRDHLDYHGSMENYGAAKAKLFAWPDLRAAVINVDDAFGRELAAQFADQIRHSGQGNVILARETSSRPRNGRDPEPGMASASRAMDGNRTQSQGWEHAQGLAGTQFHGRKMLLRYAVDGNDAELRARNVHTHSDGIDFELVTPGGTSLVRSRLLGRFNVANLLAVAGVLAALDVPFVQIREALEALEPVSGRMNRLGGGVMPLVVVDYSHTPDALEQALVTLRAHCEGRLICVFGCGGERDTGKRPLMGAIAERLADVAIVTDDNPRGEDGDAIVAQIISGMRAPGRAVVERDRARAIGLAVAQARPGDVVLVAGKGHETYQESAGVKRPFDDLQVARVALEARPC